MTDTVESCENVEKNESSEKETPDTASVKKDPDEKDTVSEVSDAVKKEAEEVTTEVKTEEDTPKDSMGALLASPDRSKNSSETSEKGNNEETGTNTTGETAVDEFVQPSSLPKVNEKDSVNSSAPKEGSVVKKTGNQPESFTDSSLSSCSEVQSSAPPFESSCSSQENYNAGRINFENAIKNEGWKEENSSGGVSEPTVTSGQEETKPNSDVPLITLDENTETSTPAPEVPSANKVEVPAFPASGFAPPPSVTHEQGLTDQTDVKPIEPIMQQPPPEPVPIPPPMPRKRGRPRKQVLPNPSPIVESWGPNAQEFQSIVGTPGKRGRGERRTTKRKRFDDDDDNLDDDGCRRRFGLKSPMRKKKRRTNFTPKRRLPPPRRKHSEYENFQNFEEETRMSASEGHGMFSSRGGMMGDESQGSSFMDGHTRGSVSKKGRMEVMTDGCKPVTVQQIVEYFWPPPSSLPFGEKPDGLMIQEQICEYLGVKSFKRKYPSIKRRPVDMEERNYLQENGFVSENMCDMGLTAVFSADILEIMYNDFPHKFEEYRKYSRERKAREQRALREKQAAERADMDPKKEAIESALSWNTEFNKTRSNYNSKVLMGNWFHQNCNDEQELAMYLKKKERNQLLTIGVRKLFESFLRHVPLSLPTKGLAYGGVIQLLAPDVISAPSHAAEKPMNGLCLAVTIDSNDIDRTQTIVENLAVVGSPLRAPCARNAFVIESDEGKAAGQAVCYGDTFYLKSVGRDDVPLYVELPVPGLSTPVGRCGFPTPKLKMCKDNDSRFKVLHVRSDLRFTTDGLPCSPFERVVINHAPNNAALCIENDYWKMSLFSYESEICANTKLDLRKQYTSPNLWMFVVGSSN